MNLIMIKENISQTHYVFDLETYFTLACKEKWEEFWVDGFRLFQS